MNTNNIKKYAPQARNQFRDAVIQKLTTLGIATDKKAIYTLPTPKSSAKPCAMVSSITRNLPLPAAIVW